MLTVGVMGGPMASNRLKKGGVRLVVHDKQRAAGDALVKAGAIWADTPKAVAEASDVVFTCLPNLAAIEEVALGPQGLIQGVKPGQAVFEMSTNSIELAKKLHAAFAAKNVQFLDAPISGGAPGARRGRLAVWVGGDKATFDKFREVILPMGDKPLHVGPIGSGLVTKLVHNCTSQAVQAALTEVFVMGVKAGAELLALWEAVRLGAVGRRRSFDGMIDQFLPGQFDDVHAALRIVHKDIVLATKFARELNVPMPISEIAKADRGAAAPSP